MTKEPGSSPSARLMRRAAAWRDGSGGRRILVGAAAIALMSGLVKLAILIRDLVLAWQFGVADDLDAFLVAFLLPSALINIVISAFAASMIPVFLRLRQEKGPLAAARLAESVLAAGTVLLIVLTIALATLGPSLIPLVAPAFGDEKRALAASLVVFLAPLVLLQGFASMWGALIHTGNRFVVVALAPVATPLLTIGALLALRPELGIYTLPLGLVLGAGVEAALLIGLARRLGLPVWPRWHGYDPGMASVVCQFGPLVAGAGMMSGTLIVDQVMAAMLEPGSVSALNYGSKLAAAVLGLAALPLGTAALPYFSEQTARQSTGETRRSLEMLVRLIVVTSVPATALLLLLSGAIVRLVFERGAFTASDSALVVSIQTMYILQIPFCLVGILGARVLSALGLNAAVMRIGAANFVLNIVLNLILMRVMGLPGIALSTSIVYACSTIMIYAVLIPRLRAPATTRASGPL